MITPPLLANPTAAADAAEAAFFQRPRYCIVAAVNDDEVMTSNLAASPVTASGDVPLLIERGHQSASLAYRAGYERAMKSRAYDAVVFAHQDVYLPQGWERKLELTIRHLDTADPQWAVLGPFGVTAEGAYVGQVWTTGLGKVVGQSLTAPVPVVTLDELLLIVRSTTGLTFDPDLPAYHMYGTDIVQTALAAGRTAYAFQGPVIHNSLPIRKLDGSYGRAYKYMQRKWADRLPLATSCVPVTPWGLPLKKHWVRASLREYIKPLPSKRRHPNPAELAAELGFAEP